MGSYLTCFSSHSLVHPDSDPSLYEISLAETMESRATTSFLTHVDDSLSFDLVSVILLDLVIQEFDARVKIVGSSKENVTEIILAVNESVEVFLELFLFFR